jgi:hypothetical protein
MSSRTLRLLRESDNLAEFPLLLSAKLELETALTTAGTKQILSLGNSSAKYWFWDDFLGDYGSQNRGEDRLFTTALAVNALFDIWTAPSANGGRLWISATPKIVRDATNAAIAYLQDKIFVDEPMNAFFSGSVKSASSLPFVYPATFSRLLNGTQIDPRKPFPSGNTSAYLIFGVDSVVPQAEYDKMLNETWFSNQVPVENVTSRDFNLNGGGWFPFWSAPSLTYSTTLLAMVNFNSLENN